jgi:endonuclease YncB( thermonuclease family)
VRRRSSDHFNKAGVARFEARRRKQRRSTAGLFAAVFVGTVAIGLGVTHLPSPTARASAEPGGGDVGCWSPTVVDGDTLRCGSTRIRLSAIDAPELPGHCRPGRACTPGDPYASQANLARLVAGQQVVCEPIDTDRYGRTVARCAVAGQNLECAQLEGGFAVERYGSVSC